MDISGLSSVTTAAEMVTWLTDNCVTPIRPAMSGEDFAAILEKVIAVAGSSEDQIGNYLKGLPGYVGDGSRFLADDLNWHSTAILELAPPAPVLVSTGPTSVLITWLPIKGAVTYTIERALDAGFTNTVTTVYSGYSLSFSDTGLVSGTQYFYRVKAVAPNLPDSAWSATVSNAVGNIFYGYVDNQWNNPNNWSALRVPVSTDNVVIAANCIYSNASAGQSVTVTACTINSGVTLTNTAGTFTFKIADNFICNGTYNPTGGSHTVMFLGSNIQLSSGFTTNTLWFYNTTGNICTVPALTYNNLTFQTGSYTLANNAVVVNGAISTTTANINLGTASLTLNGTTSFGGGTITSSGATLSCVQQLIGGGGCTFNLTSSAMYLQNGIYLNNFFCTTTGIVHFTTNNQSVSWGTSTAWFNVGGCYIGAGLTVTNQASANIWYLSGYTNGLSSSSTLINNGTMYLNDTSWVAASGNISMSTGVFNYRNASGSTIGYTFNGSCSLPYALFENLVIGGTGTKTLFANTTLNYGLTVNSGANLELSSYAISIGGATVIGGSGALLSKNSSTGAVLFAGQFSCVTGATTTFLGSPTVEFRGGIATTNGTLSLGLGTVNFTTNNQQIYANNGPFYIYAIVTIASGITLTNNGNFGISNSMNGADNTAAFVNAGILYLNGNSSQVMTTGSADFTTNVNNTIYFNGGSGQSTIYPGSFRNVTIYGTGGITKSVTGNWNILSNLSLQGTVTLELGSYSLTVNGTTSIASTCIISRAGSSTGSTIFVGAVSASGSGALNFASGNTIESRGGVFGAYINGSNVNSVTLKCTTNNQTVYAVGTSGLKLLISGAITVQATNSLLLASVDGDNASSVFNNSGTLVLYTSAVPMATAGSYNLNYGGASTVNYQGLGSFTLPNFGTLNNLLIIGQSWSGITATLSGDLTITGTLTIQSNISGDPAQLQLGNYNLACKMLSMNTYASIVRSGTGNTVFTGSVALSGGGTAINLGSNVLELQGGISVGTASSITVGLLKFTTNNQTVSGTGLGTASAPVSMLVSGAITVTFTNSACYVATINGDNLSSIAVLAGTMYYYDTTQIMSTGMLNANNTANTFIYAYAGNQNVEGGTYYNLTLNNGGTKTLQGNVSVNNTYMLASGTTLNTNGYTLTHP